MAEKKLIPSWDGSLVQAARMRRQASEAERSQTNNDVISEEHVKELFQQQKGSKSTARIYYAVIDDDENKAQTTLFKKSIQNVIKGIKEIYKLNNVDWLANADFIPKSFPFTAKIQKDKSRYTDDLDQEILQYIRGSKVRKHDALIIFDPFTNSDVQHISLGDTRFIALSFVSYRRQNPMQKNLSNFSSEITAFRTAHELLHQYILRLGYTLYGNEYFFGYEAGGHYQGASGREINLLMDGEILQSLGAVGESKILNKTAKKLNPVHQFYMQHYLKFISMFEIDPKDKEWCKQSLSWYDDRVSKEDNRLGNRKRTTNDKTDYVNIAEQYYSRSIEHPHNPNFVLFQDLIRTDRWSKDPKSPFYQSGKSQFYTKKEYRFYSDNTKQIPPNILKY